MPSKRKSRRPLNSRQPQQNDGLSACLKESDELRKALCKVKQDRAYFGAECGKLRVQVFELKARLEKSQASVERLDKALFLAKLVIWFISIPSGAVILILWSCLC